MSQLYPHLQTQPKVGPWALPLGWVGGFPPTHNFVFSLEASSQLPHAGDSLGLSQGVSGLLATGTFPGELFLPTRTCLKFCPPSVRRCYQKADYNESSNTHTFSRGTHPPDPKSQESHPPGIGEPGSRGHSKPPRALPAGVGAGAPLVLTKLMEELQLS